MVLSPKQLFVVGVIIILCTALEATRSMIPHLICSLLNDEDVRHSAASHGEVYADGSTHWAFQACTPVEVSLAPSVCVPTTLYAIMHRDGGGGVQRARPMVWTPGKRGKATHKKYSSIFRFL